MIAVEGARELEVAVPGHQHRQVCAKTSGGTDGKDYGDAVVMYSTHVTLPNMPLPSLCALPHIMTLIAAADKLLSSTSKGSSSVFRRAGIGDASNGRFEASTEWVPESRRGLGERWSAMWRRWC